TKNMAQSVTRRAALKQFGVGLAGIALACLGLATNGAAAAPAYATIDYTGGVFNIATDINARGQIVGRYTDPAGITHGFLLSGGRFFDVTPPGAVWARAIGINRDGDIVGDYSQTDPKGDKDIHSYLLHRGTFVSIDFPGAYA